MYKEKKILSEIKSELHKIHGSFQKKSRVKREQYLKELKKNPEDENLIKKILLTNRSTKEIIGNYEEIYERIFEITKKPKTITDLGCGINPFSFIFMKIKKVIYYAYDIDEEDLEFINKYFNLIKNRISGKTEILNFSGISDEEIKMIPKSDICFMFKTVDVLDKENHKQSENIIKNINSGFVIVSFPKKTLSGKKMNFPSRTWFEIMLERIDLKFEKIDFENEVFYVVKKNINS